MNNTTFTSPLAMGIERFLQYKRAAGCRYVGEEIGLRRFDRFLSLHLAGNPVITLDMVRAYVAHGGQRSDSTRGHRVSLIRELCLFLAPEDPRHEIPPRGFLGIRCRPYVQRVLSRDEGRRFLAACLSFPASPWSALRGIVHGTALALLYLTGLRRGEVLRLTIGDVDLAGKLLRVRETKFGKSRLVPIASDMAQRLRECSRFVEQHLGVRLSDAPFFPGPRGRRLDDTALWTSFQKILLSSGITQKGATKRPRLHDLRGTFAVHRLLLWYEQNAELEAKLPLLATYLGHVGLESSQRYLQLTRDLLGEVVRRQQTCFGHLITDL
jgi:integrase/recombinase XerD